ncbi:DUF885 domain-containing protein [Sphingomonas radiodurans]|uniref:DUF885 domain-containing protein n=1 Tax=Sphingomonas radiodurans TaxID=2890321 RepID=UPI001E44A44F|nr:DUF885 family protein [Sphingomonas radiodurans]WBH16606.1 DUF885 family protein [Sphingomonas radiodurans]
MTHIDRRAVIAGLGAATTSAALPAFAQPVSRDAQLDALLMRQFDAELALSPTGATQLGLDKGKLAALRSRLPDWSPAGLDRDRAMTMQHLRDLRSFGRTGLGTPAAIAYDSADFTLSSRAKLDEFRYHSGGFGHRPGPYAVTQLGGFYTGLANFMDLQHPVKTRADADAYLARLAAVPALLDADTRLVTENAAAGVIAPRFILDQAIRQVTAFRDGDVRTKTLVTSVERRATALGLTGYGDRAAAIFETGIKPAATRQIEALTAVLPRAGNDAGVARLPRGREYYAAALRSHTTIDIAPDEVHRIGLEQVADLTARIDTLLKAQGLTRGTMRERLDELARRPGQTFANDDAGRAALLAYLNDRLDAVRKRVPQVFARMPTLPYEIRRVPPEIEGGAPGGSAQRGLADGSRPGIFFINLRDTHEWPRYSLPTLAYHEGAPGHLFEGALSLQNAALPIYRQTASATAYGEGWGLYAEQVADELGMYEDDPLGKIGYLGSYAFRASRLVVDTGMHHLGWSREKAIDFLSSNSSESPSAARTEVDRYIVYPGQACAYKMGQIAISRLRAEAEKQPGFDIKRFHTLVLDTGRVPLTVLERRVRESFIA